MQSPIVRALYGKLSKKKSRPPLFWKPSKSKLKQIFPKNKMSKKETLDKLSSFQLLTEGHVEVVIEKGQHKLNISELLRDLYAKHYALQSMISDLKAAEDLNNFKSGGPPEID